MKAIHPPYLGKNVTIVTKTGSIIRGNVEKRIEDSLIITSSVFLQSPNPNYSDTCTSLQIDISEIEVFGTKD